MTGNLPRVKAQVGRSLEDPQSLFQVFTRGGLFLYLEADGDTRTACFWEAATFSSEKVQSQLLAFLSSAGKGVSPKSTNAKLIGAPSLVGDAKRILHREGVALKKVIEAAGDLEILYTPADGRIRLARDSSAEVAAAPLSKKTRILIVDDSKTIRSLLTKIFSSDPDLEVVGAIGNPSEAEAAIEKFKPNVITLDIHMPEMDGVTLLKRYISRSPIPTVMISSIGMEEGTIVLSALENGAVDYIQKPGFDQIEQATPVIIEKVKTASRIRVRKNYGSTASRIDSRGQMDLSRVIAIGSSTGGTEALREVLIRLPEQIPPILIVQHIPPVFSFAFAKRLNELCPFEVKEAEDGDEVRAGRVLIAPGGHQMKVKKAGLNLRVAVDKSPPVNRHQPSVDVLFDSVAEEIGPSALGAILTGMGADGAKGLLKMKQLGSHTIAQNEETCVVYGMPQAAVKLGAAEAVLPLFEIPGRLVELLSKKRSTAA